MRLDFEIDQEQCTCSLINYQVSYAHLKRLGEFIKSYLEQLVGSCNRFIFDTKLEPSTKPSLETMNCPNIGCVCLDITEWNDKKVEYAKKTKFICRDCGQVSCFYCGDWTRKLCEECKEARLDA